ncbi:hypothetical protein OS965_29940 [Streptomyces sp. H27-G5]|uniref:hypothetical protein n=1 Tax=Streptomyces sp. H27-G5 TaxID=2996698 RepID=UPI0022718609|nr:hypothetical protein [Streptomyces sp. H27-G5]MCY0922332.1 hypothetical protein [Streptomyces sp. H27-G5]
MAFKTATCLTAACDECGHVLETPDGGEVHFATEQQARDSAATYEWEVLEDGRLICPDGHLDLLEEHGRLQPGPGAMTFTFDTDTDPEVLL